jgi:hypothetical protein
MSVTEFALLRLKPPHIPPQPFSPSLLPILAKARDAMQTFSGKHFYILQQVEDPTYIYILGSWSTLSSHMDVFIPSAVNQELLKELEPLLDIVWLHHLQAPTELDPSANVIPVTEDGVVSFGRHFVAPARKEAFEQGWLGVQTLLYPHIKAGTKPLAGWDVTPPENEEEFVMVAGWDAVENHIAFGGTPEGKEYLKVVLGLIDRGEVKHGKLLKLED